MTHAYNISVQTTAIVIKSYLSYYSDLYIYLCFFFSCFIFSLSMQPFEHPLCTKDGVIFDLL